IEPSAGVNGCGRIDLEKGAQIAQEGFAIIPQLFIAIHADSVSGKQAVVSRQASSVSAQLGVVAVERKPVGTLLQLVIKGALKGLEDFDSRPTVHEELRVRSIDRVAQNRDDTSMRKVLVNGP